MIKDRNERHTKTFRKYTDIANYLDANLQYKNKKIFLFNSICGLPKNVTFDGVCTYIEGYGNV